MSGPSSKISRLEQARDRMARWRERHGGRGIPLPDALWAEAVDIARREGVGATARVLRVNRGRLEARMGDNPEQQLEARVAGEGGPRFVEVDTSRVCLPPGGTVIRWQGRDGERLEVELGAGATVDVVLLAQTFWSRQQ